MVRTHLVEGGVELAGLDGLDGGDGLHAPRSPQAVPDHALSRVHLDLAGIVEHLAQGLDLRNVSHQGARGMGVDVVDLTAAGPGSASCDICDIINHMNRYMIYTLSCCFHTSACCLLA